MKSYSIAPITGLLKARFKVINAILGESFTPDGGVDIFIDLNTIVSALSSSQKFQNSLPFAEDVEQDIISSILMIIKHWKDYSKKWEDVRIFMFVNDFNIVPLPERNIINSYLVPMINKYQNDRFKQFVYYWNESIKRVEIILKYVPNSYIINCKTFDSYVIPNIIDDYSNNKRKRIIISGNPLLTNYHYMKDTYIIYTRYKHDGMCQVSDPITIVQSMTKVEDEIISTFTKNKVFYNILNAIVGDFNRGLIGLTQLGITKFATTLLRAVEKREIPENPMSIESVLPVIDTNYHDYLKKTYPLIDIETHSSLIPKSTIEKTKASMIDLYDIDGLRSLSINGLNLLELL